MDWSTLILCLAPARDSHLWFFQLRTIQLLWSKVKFLMCGWYYIAGGSFFAQDGCAYICIFKTELFWIFSSVDPQILKKEWLWKDVICSVRKEKTSGFLVFRVQAKETNWGTVCSCWISAHVAKHSNNFWRSCVQGDCIILQLDFQLSHAF